MNIEIFTKVLIPLLGAILTYLIVPLILQKTTKQQRENIYFWVTVAVQAAEMIYKGKGQGKLKKEYVIDFLTSKGIRLTIQELDALIEAAVLELNITKEKLGQD